MSLVGKEDSGLGVNSDSLLDTGYCFIVLLQTYPSGVPDYFIPLQKVISHLLKALSCGPGSKGECKGNFHALFHIVSFSSQRLSLKNCQTVLQVKDEWIPLVLLHCALDFSFLD
ncbi:UNVERIFIED_CONTAM: hypothetical protein K2H54_023316 [Gekko kuhli]